MPKNNDIKCVLVIGSGPVVIGQAAEFDYAGSQACLSLREEGIRVVLLNSNPATIQTDFSIADRIYIEPIEVETVVEIIKKEKVDSILPTMGGQTALNLVVELNKLNILDSLGVRVIGTPVDSIEKAEDRKKFHKLMTEISEPVAESLEITRSNFEEEINGLSFMPVIVRTSFSLGGLSGSIIRTKEELLDFSQKIFSSGEFHSFEVERSIEGLKELEYEMIRDNAGNCITVCNMENLDPMGVHTGESIVVTPSQTLSDIEYHNLRSSARKVIETLGIRGACNIQFALDPESEEYYVVEVNPRTSRSSALASKASGYPIARVSTKIALGYNLNEISNPITGNTFVAFEPSLDYITVKIPRWPFDKFAVDRSIGVQMKSIGEVMGIGRTFEEAFMKAIASLDTEESVKLRIFSQDEKLRALLSSKTDMKAYAIFEALFRGYNINNISKMTGYDPYFIHKFNNVVKLLRELRIGEIPANLGELKALGVSDDLISHFIRIPALSITKRRIFEGIVPAYKTIDTCSGEFEAKTPYLYSTYEEESEFDSSQETREKIIVMGSGSNRISQGLEFDYGSVKAVQTLRDLGYVTIMVNCNPETVSTDFDISDYLYFEPLTLEHVSNIVKREKPKGIIIQFSGQTGQNIASGLSEMFGEGIILGTSPSDIGAIEERTIFASRLKQLGIKQPDFVTVVNEQETDGKINSIDLPVIVRSSFIIGGRAMDIVYDTEILSKRVRSLFEARPGYPVLISKYVDGATETDVDFISNHEKAVICGISVHIEEAGTHSGDATMVIGPDLIKRSLYEKIENIVATLAKQFHLSGISNLQIAVKEDDIYIIELNARSSRSLPFVSKATGIDWVSLGIKAILGHPIEVPNGKAKSYFVKVPVFPFKRFSDLDTILGPEMKSTGEGMGAGLTFEEAVAKATRIFRKEFSFSGSVLITVNDRDKAIILEIAKILAHNGIKIFSTPGTSKFLNSNGIDATTIYRMNDLREPKMSKIISTEKISMIINTPTMKTGSIRDGFNIRRMAIQKDIPMITNANLAKAVVASALNAEKIGYREIREYYGGESDR